MKRRTFFAAMGAVLAAACGVKAGGFPRIITAEWCKANGYVHLFDANGQPIDFAYWADLQTGEVRQFSKDENGRKYFNGKWEIARETNYYPAPLRAEWKAKA